MAYNAYSATIRQILAGFSARPELAAPLERFAEAPDVPRARDLLRAYFAGHRQGDVAGLRRITSAFSDKRVVRDMVASILADPAQLEAIAGRSYPHPIGFDKLVLHHERSAVHGFKLRLHIYWRSPQELAAERIHLHRFEMASSPITGELTNHLYAVRACEAPDIASEADGQASDDNARGYHAYSGYWRDPKGILHKRFLGLAQLQFLSALTFVPGQTYAQGLQAPHYVETNAETGHTNRDVCSTIYIHGPGLSDTAGRRIPILFEEQRIPDSVIDTIPNLQPAALRQSLVRYLGLLEESLRFYDWLYDPQYGRNLSVGMVAGYLLSEAFGSERTIEEWESHRQACEEVLERRSQMLARLVRGEQSLAGLAADARETRYFQQLLNKSYAHPAGREDWLRQYGNLAGELERYLGALLGDYARNPDLKVLKPIWEMPTTNLRGGAHYGHVAAMLEAARAAQPLALRAFRGEAGRVREKPAGAGPVSEVDCAVQACVRAVLQQHYPRVGFVGEEGVAEEIEGSRRWLVDPIDGTRNFLAGSKNFALSIAHQHWTDGRWQTSDALVALPAHGEIYWAERGQGAFLIAADGREQRLQVGDHQPGLRGALIDLSARGLGKAETDLFACLREAGAVPRASGSAALMLALVSGCGNHGALITAQPWDVAAGLLICREAGGQTAQRELRGAGTQRTATLAAVSGEVLEALEELLDGVLGT